LLTAAGQAPHLAGGRVRVVESSNKGLRIERKRIRHQQEVRLLRRRDTEELFPGGGLIRTPRQRGAFDVERDQLDARQHRRGDRHTGATFHLPPPPITPPAEQPMSRPEPTSAATNSGTRANCTR